MRVNGHASLPAHSPYRRRFSRECDTRRATEAARGDSPPCPGAQPGRSRVRGRRAGGPWRSPGARPPGGRAVPGCAAAGRAVNPVIVTTTGSDARGCDNHGVRISSRMRPPPGDGGFARRRRSFAPGISAYRPEDMRGLRAKRHTGPSRSARGVAGAGLAVVEPDMSGYWADNPFGSLGFDGNSGPGGTFGAGSGTQSSARSRFSAINGVATPAKPDKLGHNCGRPRVGEGCRRSFADSGCQSARNRRTIGRAGGRAEDAGGPANDRPRRRAPEDGARGRAARAGRAGGLILGATSGSSPRVLVPSRRRW